MQEKTKLYVAASSILVLLLMGTLFYHNTEKWSYIDSFYFTSITVTTIGYGDFHPTTTVSKLGTVALAFIGVAIVLYSLTIIASSYFEQREKILLEHENAVLHDKLKGLVINTASTVKETANNLRSRFDEKLKDKPE